MMRWRRCRCNRLSGLLLTVAFIVFAGLQFMVSQDHQVADVRSLKEDFSREGRKLFQNQDINSDVTHNRIFSLHAADSRLVNHVKTLIRSSTPEEYNLTQPNQLDYSRGQSLRIDEFLHSKRDGSFIEIGAYDGEKHSVSLYFERYRHWQGLLIEPNTDNYESILQKHRKVSTINACVKVNSSESTAFLTKDNKVLCLWLETILLASGLKQFDLLSIDAKDQELGILKSLPFERFIIDVITIEFADDSNAQSSIISYLDSKQYVALHHFINHPYRKSDLIFVRKNLMNR